MTFLGIISNEKDFEIIKSEILKQVKNLEIICINKKNIKNLQNVRFETLIIDEELSIKPEDVHLLEKICKNLKYLIINTDKNKNLDIFSGNRLHVITYGLNHKCTVTVSSIGEESIMVALQREILDKYGNLMEIGEKRVNKMQHLDIYGNMAIFITELIYNKESKM